MSEVAIVAGITGASSVLTSGVTALVTWRISQNSSAVELAKVNAENDRLQHTNREEERRNRQSTYHQHLNSLIVLFQLMGTEASKESIDDACDTYAYLHAGVVLFAPGSVREAAYEVSQTYGKIWPALTKEREENPTKPAPERWRNATADLKDKFGAEIVNLTALMHADVTRGIADDPTSTDDN